MASQKDQVRPAAKRTSSGLTHAEFFEKALAAAGEWARFADPKALAVLVLLGLGANDLVKNAKRLTDAHGMAGAWAEIATWSFWLAVGLAAVVVICVSIAVFPRLATKWWEQKGPRSLFFFAGVAEQPTAAAYERAVRKKSPQQLESEIATQAYEVAGVAKRKHDWTQRAYVAALVFLVVWVAARISLSYLS